MTSRIASIEAQDSTRAAPVKTPPVVVFKPGKAGACAEDNSKGQQLWPGARHAEVRRTTMSVQLPRKTCLIGLEPHQRSQRHSFLKNR